MTDSAAVKPAAAVGDPTQESASARGQSSIAVLADDLIWASRLVDAVERAGARAVPVRSAAQLSALIEGAGGVAITGFLVDLGTRGYDGLDAIAAAARSGMPVIGVGQHEDLALRKRALAAGAVRVFSYNKMFSDGPAVVAAWLMQGVKA